MKEHDVLCLVTGATSGVGRAVAAGLAKTGVRVILLGRDSRRTEAVRECLAKETSNPRIDAMTADLSDQESVRRFARRFLEEFPVLHVLSLNHGVLLPKRETTADGIEKTWAVNYLSGFMLSGLLLPALRAGSPARILSVVGSPGLLRMTRLGFEEIGETGRYNGFRAIRQSVLARLVFTQEIASRLTGEGVTANVFHPGIVRSGFGRHLPAFLRFLHAAASPLMSRESPTGVWAATDPGLGAVSGAYFVRKRPVLFSSPHVDAEVRKRLWNFSERMTGVVPEFSLTVLRSGSGTDSGRG
ncbi:MAG TPA: SDR family NAD(P)-dependent oxidoreductase [bacterium]|nr:SDR family NAD(P)-dependent oxidoreductase [bacterium]